MGNQSSSIQPQLDHARRIGVCSLNEKRLTEFPARLLEMTKTLRSIDLSSNQLLALPVEIGSFSSLKTLSVDRNKLSSLPAELCQLSKLETLTVQANRLTSFPMGLAGLTHLKTVSLAGNELTEFPSGLCECPQLQLVDLSANKITRLPESIGKLSTVELNLNRNRLPALPTALADCPRLKVLRVEENCLSVNGIPTRLLTDSRVSTLCADGNNFPMRELEQSSGYEKYTERYTATRKKVG